MKALFGVTSLLYVVALMACSSLSVKNANAAADAWVELLASVNRAVKNNSSAIDADFREWKGMASLCAARRPRRRSSRSAAAHGRIVPTGKMRSGIEWDECVRPMTA